MPRPTASLLRLAGLTIALAATLTGCGRPTAPPTAPRAAFAARAAEAPAPGPGGAAPADEGEAPEDLTLLPRFSRTGRGVAGDPINLVIAGTERQVIEGFDQAGWLPADPITFWNVMRMLKAGVTRGEYPTSPMSALYLFGRVQDLDYQKNPRSIIARDHLRVWRTPLLDAHGRPYWAVAATKDVRVGWQKTAPTHRIDPAIDAERALVVADWIATGRVARRLAYQAVAPGYEGRNGGGDPYVTDGRVIVLDLAVATPEPVTGEPAAPPAPGAEPPVPAAVR